MDKEVRSSYVPLDIEAAVNEHNEYVKGGETCRVDGFKDVFAWMRGTMNGWYGYASDGKSEMRDFLKVLKAKYDDWKFCLFRPEDMDSVLVDGKIEIRANTLYKNLAWTLTGKTWNRRFAEQYGVKAMTLDEEMKALEWVTKHFFVIYPFDRTYKNILTQFETIHHKYGIDGFEIDPLSGLILPNTTERGDERLANVYFDIKEFALKTNSCVDIVNHPKTGEVKDKEGRYKVVNQFMVLGGSMNDAKMDGQFSVYRPERHINQSDTKVHLYNLKQKNSQLVGVKRGGEQKNIDFDYVKKQYYINGINPMDGSVREPKFKQNPIEFKHQPPPPPSDEPKTDICPF